MPGLTYKLIASQTITTPTATVNFDNIPGTYKDLIVLLRAFGSTQSGYPFIQPNGSTASLLRNYLTAGGTTITVSNNQPNSQMGENALFTTTAGAFSVLQIMNYSDSTVSKFMLHRANRPEGGVDLQTIRWSNQAVIRSLGLSSTVSYGVGSSFWLYGVIG